MLRKFQILLITIIFFATNVFNHPGLCSPSGKLTAPGLNVRPSVVTASHIRISPRLGAITKRFDAQRGKLAILIEDAHAVPAAQVNIRKMINYFQARYGVRYVGLEGASGQLVPQIFRSFPDQTILQKVFRRYMEDGELTGGTAAAIFNRMPATYVGLEEWNLYEEGLALYLRASQQSRLWERKIAYLRKKIARLKTIHYSKPLLEVDRELEAFDVNFEGLPRLLRKLAQIKEIPPNGRLASLKKMFDSERLDEGALKAEIEQLAQSVFSQMTNGTLAAEFNRKYQMYQTSEISDAEFALFLKQINDKQGLRFEGSSALSSRLREYQQLRDPNSDTIIDELRTYASSVKESLFRQKDERHLDGISASLSLLQKMAKVQLSRQEWEYLQNQFAGDLPTTGEWKGWRRVERKLFYLMRDARLFYANALERDDVFYGALMEMFKKARLEAKKDSGEAGSVIFVTGGFHSDGLTRHLEKSGISHIVVRPRLESAAGHETYEKLMKGEVSWKSYFRIENGKIDLHHAFVRAARDRLLGHYPGQERRRQTLKTWRDQIIRDLAGKGNVGGARKYTSLIDEVFEDRKGQDVGGVLSSGLSSKIDELIHGLKALDLQNRFSEKNILELLSPSAMSPRSLANALVPGALATPEEYLIKLPNKGTQPGQFPIRPIFSSRKSYSETKEHVRTEGPQESAQPGFETDEKIAGTGTKSASDGPEESIFLRAGTRSEMRVWMPGRAEMGPVVALLEGRESSVYVTPNWERPEKIEFQSYEQAELKEILKEGMARYPYYKATPIEQPVAAEGILSAALVYDPPYPVKLLTSPRKAIVKPLLSGLVFLFFLLPFSYFLVDLVIRVIDRRMTIQRLQALHKGMALQNDPKSNRKWLTGVIVSFAIAMGIFYGSIYLPRLWQSAPLTLEETAKESTEQAGPIEGSKGGLLQPKERPIETMRPVIERSKELLPPTKIGHGPLTLSTYVTKDTSLIVVKEERDLFVFQYSGQTGESEAAIVLERKDWLDKTSSMNLKELAGRGIVIRLRNDNGDNQKRIDSITFSLVDSKGGTFGINLSGINPRTESWTIPLGSFGNIDLENVQSIRLQIKGAKADNLWMQFTVMETEGERRARSDIEGIRQNPLIQNGKPLPFTEQLYAMVTDPATPAEVRSEIIRTLMTLPKSEKVFSLLIPIAKEDPDFQVRREAVSALSAVNDGRQEPALVKQAFETLQQSLKDPNEHVRRAAQKAVEKFQAEESMRIDHYVKTIVFGDSNHSLLALAAVHEDRGPGIISKVLDRLMTIERDLQREFTRRTALQLAGPDEVTVYNRNINRISEMMSFILSAHRDTEEIKAMLERMRQSEESFWRVLSLTIRAQDQSEKSFNELKDTLRDEDANLRMMAVSLLPYFEGDKKADEVRRIMDKMLKDRKFEEPDELFEKREIEKAIHRIKIKNPAPQDIDRLFKILESGEYWERYDAAIGLSKIPLKITRNDLKTQPLKRILSSIRASDMKLAPEAIKKLDREIFFVMHDLGRPRPMHSPEMIRLMANEAAFDAVTGERAIIGFLEKGVLAGGNQAVPLLIEALKAGNAGYHTELAAIRILGEMKEKSAIPLLEERLKNPKMEPEILVMTLQSLKAIGDIKSLPAIYEFLERRDPASNTMAERFLKYHAIVILKDLVIQTKNPAAIKRAMNLIKNFFKDRDPGVRQEAEDSYNKLLRSELRAKSPFSMPEKEYKKEAYQDLKTGLKETWIPEALSMAEKSSYGAADSAEFPVVLFLGLVFGALSPAQKSIALDLFKPQEWRRKMWGLRAVGYAFKELESKMVYYMALSDAVQGPNGRDALRGLTLAYPSLQDYEKNVVIDFFKAQIAAGKKHVLGLMGWIWNEPEVLPYQEQIKEYLISRMKEDATYEPSVLADIIRFVDGTGKDEIYKLLWQLAGTIKDRDHPVFEALGRVYAWRPADEKKEIYEFIKVKAAGGSASAIQGLGHALAYLENKDFMESYIFILNTSRSSDIRKKIAALYALGMAYRGLAPYKDSEKAEPSSPAAAAGTSEVQEGKVVPPGAKEPMSPGETLIERFSRIEFDPRIEATFPTSYEIFYPAEGEQGHNPGVQTLMQKFDRFETLNFEVLTLLNKKIKAVGDFNQLIYKMEQMVKVYLDLFKQQSQDISLENIAAAPGDLAGGRTIARVFLRIKENLSGKLKELHPASSSGDILNQAAEAMLQPFDGEKAAGLISMGAERYSESQQESISFAELINIVHQKGIRNLSDLIARVQGARKEMHIRIRRQSAVPKKGLVTTEALDLMGQDFKLQYLDARTQPDSQPPYPMNFVAKAFSKGQLIHENYKLFTPSNALLLADEKRVIIGMKLGAHSARIQFALMPVQEGGRVAINYTDSGPTFSPGSNIRIKALADAFQKAGFKVHHSGYALDAYFDKDSGASSIAELPEKLEFAIQVLSGTKDLDLFINNSPLRNNPDLAHVMAFHYEADGFLSREVLPEWRNIPYEAYAHLRQIGVPFPGTGIGHRGFERILAHVRLLESRGALLRMPDGSLKRNDAYEKASKVSPLGKIITLLEDAGGDPRVQLKAIAWLARAVESFSHRRLIGYVGPYQVEQIILPLTEDQITFYVLKDPQSSAYLIGYAVLGEFFFSHRRYSEYHQDWREDNNLSLKEILFLISRLNMDRSEALKKWVEEQGSNYSELEKTVPSRSLLEAFLDKEVIHKATDLFKAESLFETAPHKVSISSKSVRGISIQEGKALGRVALKSDEKKPEAYAGKIMLAVYTEPSDDLSIRGAAGLVVTTGGILSHAAIRSREYQKPALIVNGAKLSLEALSFSRFSGSEIKRQYTFRGKTLDVYELSDYGETIEEVKDGDIVYLDANSGIFYVLAKAGDEAAVSAFGEYEDWKETRKTSEDAESLNRLVALLRKIKNGSLLRGIVHEMIDSGIMRSSELTVVFKAFGEESAEHAAILEFLEQEVDDEIRRLEQNLQNFQDSVAKMHDVEQAYLAVEHFASRMERLRRFKESSSLSPAVSDKMQAVEVKFGQVLENTRSWMNRYQETLLSKIRKFEPEPHHGLLSLLRLSAKLDTAGLSLKSARPDLADRMSELLAKRNEEVAKLVGRGIIWKQDLKDRFARPIAGGKGANSAEIQHALGILKKAGSVDMEVYSPEGFVIQPEEYRLWKKDTSAGIDEFLRKDVALGYRDLVVKQMHALNLFLEVDPRTGEGLKHRLRSLLQRTDKIGRIHEAEAIDTVILSLRLAIASMLEKVDQNEISQSLQNRLRVLGAVAVRSSGLREDSESEAMAGLRETKLNIAGLDAIYEAILEVWQSGAEGILIDEMINPKVSGIAFSADPVARNTQHIRINAAYGLGKGLVDAKEGVESPDSFIISKQQEGAAYPLVSSFIGQKRQMVVLDLEKGDVTVKKVQLGSEEAVSKQQTPALTAEQIQKVARTVDQLAQFFGFQGDMEFSFDSDQRLVVLQFRPITTIREALERGRQILRSEVREASVSRGDITPKDAARIMIRQVIGKGISRSELVEAARAAVREGAGETIREVEEWKVVLEAKMIEIAEREIARLGHDLSSLPDQGYAVGYAFDRSNEERPETVHFIRSIKTIGRISQVIVSREDPISDAFSRGLREAGILIRRDNFDNPNLIFTGDQERAGLITNAANELNLPASNLKFTVIASLGTSAERAAHVSKLVSAIQTAVAVLLAYESRHRSHQDTLIPAELLKQYEWFSGVETPVIQSDGRHLFISAAAVRAFLEWTAMQEIMKSA